MSYLVLARKYRPRTFAEVTGQEVVTRTLQGAIAEERVGHAYLFHGPRGTGKTTTARIFAKALNCERGPAAEPCGECPRCKAADAGSEVDLIEIDAASHTMVADVRELREQANYAPMRARLKIYIIDEVHMLSRSAFNALLKTLEEPPPHVKFLFATTELHKVPDTILSRCQVMKLSPLGEPTIAARLDEVFAREGVQAEAGVSAALARRARGGMRDALSLADQLLALVGDAPRLEDVGRLASAADREALQALLDAVRAGERARLLELLPRTDGGEAELLEALLELVRRSLVVALCGADSPVVDDPPEARPWMVAFGGALGPDRLELWLEELLAARERVRQMPGLARTTLELALFALARPATTVPVAELVERLAALESALAAGVPPRPPAPAAAPARAPAPAAAPARPGELTPAPPPAAEPGAPARRAAPPSVRTLRASSTEAWRAFLEALGEGGSSLAEVLARCGRLVELEGGRAVVRLEGLREVERPVVAEPRNARRCAKVLSELMGEPFTVELVDVASLRPGRNDPFTQEVADLFGGRIED